MSVLNLTLLGLSGLAFVAIAARFATARLHPQSAGLAGLAFDGLADHEAPVRGARKASTRFGGVQDGEAREPAVAAFPRGL